MKNKQIGDSIGLEFEFPLCSRVELRLPMGWKAVHDASSEHAYLMLADMTISESQLAALPEALRKRVRLAKTGGELVSPVLDINSDDDIASIVSAMRQLLVTNPAMDDRSSTHVHINVTEEYPLYALKNLIRIVMSVEKYLYRLSGFNTVNRGVVNKFLFQRPLRSPQYMSVQVNGDTMYMPSFEVDNLLNSSTKQEFWKALANARADRKYNPARYSGVSLNSILTRGSVEFRYGNMCFDDTTMFAYIALCRNIVRASFNISLTDELKEERPLTTVLANNEDHSLDVFRDILSNHLYLDSADIEILMKVCESVEEPFLDSDRPLVTHLQDVEAGDMYNSRDLRTMIRSTTLVSGDAVDYAGDIYKRGDALYKELAVRVSDKLKNNRFRNPFNQVPEEILDLVITKETVFGGHVETKHYDIYLKFRGIGSDTLGMWIVSKKDNTLTNMFRLVLRGKGIVREMLR